MGDSNGRLLNPWVLNFQKLGLELKCPLCLNFLNRPMLLPCNHIFCNRCMPCTTQFGTMCSVCKARCVDGDLRPVPFMENMATIYKCLDATFCATLFQPTPTDDGRVLGQSPVSINIKFDDKTIKESLESAQGEMTGKHSMPKDVRGQNMDMNGKKGTKFNGAMNSCSQSSRSHIKAGENKECGTVEIEMNQMEQSSPDSPPSLDDAKGSDNHMFNQSSERSSENWLVERPRENGGNKIGQLRNESSASENDSHLRDVKRAKKMNYGPAELGITSAGGIQAVSQAGSLMTDSHKNICAFCQSSKISEVSGSMLHYSSGDLVVGDEANHPGVIHVHRACIDWAPQVYYFGETVKNLKSEVARGAKLKCSGCGLKGAALGCYVKSCRRSYHVTCAMENSNCRWDHEDFLMLCPVHSAVRFPNEKLNSRKRISKDHALSTQMSSPTSKSWVPSSNKEKEWVLCGSALSNEQKILLVKFGNMTGAHVSKFWNPNVTHMIAATDENGACTRTLKFLMAILNGKWILKFDWIKACMEAMHHVDEEPYEVSLDNYGCCDGPKTGRLRALNNELKLFNGLKFYFAGDFVLSYKEDIKDLVKAAGGTVLESREVVGAQSCNEQESSKTLVVYNIDPPEGCKLGEEVSILWQRLSEAEDVANKTGSQVIGHTWLLESIAGCKLQPIVS